MKYSVPNAPDVPYLDQAEPDDFDFQSLGNRSTGIVEGGEVTALGTPGPSVQVSAGTAVIKDYPVFFEAGTVAVANGGGNARFDIIAVSNQGVLVNISGAASPNPLFNTFDFDTYAPLASVYVPPGSTSVLGSRIAPKSPTAPKSFIRRYRSADETFAMTFGPSSTFTISADGSHHWGLSTLKRMTDTAMEWATGLVMKAIDVGAPILALRAAPGTTFSQRLLSVQGSGGNELGYIDGDGLLYTDNIKTGTGNPNGVVVGRKGDVFIARDLGGSSLGIWQKGGIDGTTSSWSSYRVYDPTESSLPTGSIIHSLATTAPVGFIAPVGQWINTSGATAELAAVIGARYGSQSSQVKMPDLRGMTLCFAGGGLGLFGTLGAANLNISEANLPPHSHNVNDPGHEHPEAGPHAYIRPWQYHNNRHPVPSNEALEHVYTEPASFDKHARTGITLGNTGAGEPISMFQPTHTVNLYVKL